MKTKLIEFPLFPLEQTANPVLPIDNAIGSTAETEPPPALATDEETAVSKTAKPSQPKVRTEKNSTEGIVKEEVEPINKTPSLNNVINYEELSNRLD